MTEKIQFFPNAKAEEAPQAAELDTSSIVVDLPADSASEEDEALLPEDFDPEELDIEAARTVQHPMQTPWTKMAVVFVLCTAGFAVLMLWYNSAKGVKLTKKQEKTERVQLASAAEVNANSDRIENAVQSGNIARERAADKLAEAEKQNQKDARTQNKPAPRPPSRSTTASRPAPPPPRSPRPRPRIASRPAPPPRRVSPAPPPRPAPRSAPAPAPVVAKAKPVDRSPVYGGQLPQAESAPVQPNQPEFESQLVSQQAEFDEFASGPGQNAPLAAQQDAFLQGQTMTTVPSGTTLRASVESEAIASDSATFTAVTTEEIAGIPQGSEVLAQIVQLAPGGYFEAELIALNGSEVSPGSTRIFRDNGKLMRAKGGKRKKGFFSSGLGRMLTGFAQDAGESWIRDRVGGNRTLNNGAREVLVLADQPRSRQSDTREPEETSVLIPTGSIVITFEQEAYISR
ncbi:hypothetical protein C1752_10588 [Acaryochloris thomasi RCC1774]|uniref:Uncharacterized protein n=1 Tax=Acaryochloris thomasi RCC1774 TaxID=1764569 RepID=A0A2W1JMS0_9CYAN|nr:hypothetical protein [Acaryochloris thomasi]PZD70581.1 hypothetical protein C1752_10588 [Acaryochloris thomasi RCC1774]